MEVSNFNLFLKIIYFLKWKKMGVFILNFKKGGWTYKWYSRVNVVWFDCVIMRENNVYISGGVIFNFYFVNFCQFFRLFRVSVVFF